MSRVVLVRLAEAGDAVGAHWLEAFSRLQVDETRDLSACARAALELVVQLEKELGLEVAHERGARDAPGPAAQRWAPLRDACHHLRAHCRAILGLGCEDA